jgi:hypothetical protein
MKGHEFIRIRAAIQSLTDSTGVAVIHDGIKCQIKGRCSSYVSHRTIEYAHADDSPVCDWAFQNSRYLVVIHRWYKEPPEAAQKWIRSEHKEHDSYICMAEVPASLCEGLVAMMREYFGWRGKESMLTISIAIPKVQTWEDRRPVFAKYMPNVSAEEVLKYVEPMFNESQVSNDYTSTTGD